jgi:hypothetical protein
MPNGNKKGGNFEREMCKKLSLWWTYGERDDVFWRSSQSGGRATIRRRKGLSTAGSYGDIIALDPIGEPLLKTFTIELKRGKSHGEPGDLLDCKDKSICKHPFSRTLIQASEAAGNANSDHWMIIARRDQRNAVVFFPTDALEDFPPGVKINLTKPPVVRYLYSGWDFVGMPLDKFLEVLDPEILPQK